MCAFIVTAALRGNEMKNICTRPLIDFFVRVSQAIRVHFVYNIDVFIQLFVGVVAFAPAPSMCLICFDYANAKLSRSNV